MPEVPLLQAASPKPLKRVKAIADLNRERRLRSILTPGIRAVGITVNKVSLWVSCPVSVEPPRVSSQKPSSGSWRGGVIGS